MTRYVIIGLLMFAVFAVAFAPATLISGRINAVPGATATEARGTIWSGSTALAFESESLGRLHWTFRPGALASLQLSYDTVLTAANDRVDARVAFGAARWHAVVNGTLSAARFDNLMARYDIHVPGTLRINNLRLAGRWNAPVPAANGELHWNGGEVRYRLGGADYAAHLPELTGFIDSASGKPEMTVYPDENEVPLMMSHLDHDGWITFAVTRKFTELVGRPWQGEAPEHAVVVEVQEKLF